MFLQAAFFYLFAFVTIGSGLMVIGARNPVHAVLFLILAFFNAAGLFLLLGAEFLAMILVIVYVGAVAVLFLFVVMMLDVDFAELRTGFLKHAPLGLLIGLGLLAELLVVLGATVMNPTLKLVDTSNVPIDAKVTNTVALGRVLYTKFAYVFEVAGLILLTAMIGAIVLTLRHKVGVKRQSISAQNARTPATGMDIVKVPSGGYVIPDKAAAKEQGVMTAKGLMTSKRATIAFTVALVAADLLYRLVGGGVFALCVVAAVVVAVLAQLSVLGVGATPTAEIVIGLALGIVASGVIKYLVFHAFA